MVINQISNELIEAGAQAGDQQHSGQQGQLLAVREVARLLGIHVNTVRMWADCGILDSYRIGPRKDRRIPMEAVARLLELARR